MKNSVRIYLSIILYIWGIVFYGCTRQVPDVINSQQPQDYFNPTPTSQELTIYPTEENIASEDPKASLVSRQLTVTVRDQKKEPVPNANVILEDINGNWIGEQRTDHGGVVVWEEIGVVSIGLIILADGYLELKETVILQNERQKFEVELRIDPYLLTPEKACRTEEQFLYMEDFQDRIAVGWQEINQENTGWAIRDDPQDPGNSVLFANSTDVLFSRLDGGSFVDMVWRLKFKVIEPFEGKIAFQWLCTIDACYHFEILFDQSSEPLLRVGDDGPVILSDPNISPPKADTWHLLELSSYQGLVWVFLDGEEYNTYLDINPLHGGTVGLEFHTGGGIVMVDDFSICELYSPFIPIQMEIPTE